MEMMPTLCSSCPILDEAPSEAKEVKNHLPEKQSILPVCPQCSQAVLGELPVSPSTENMTESLGKTHSSRNVTRWCPRVPWHSSWVPWGAAKAKSSYPISRRWDTKPDLGGQWAELRQHLGSCFHLGRAHGPSPLWKSPRAEQPQPLLPSEEDLGTGTLTFVFWNLT